LTFARSSTVKHMAIFREHARCLCARSPLNAYQQILTPLLCLFVKPVRGPVPQHGKP